MRIVHLTSVHRWDDVRIFWKMCRSLAAAGMDTHLVAPRNDISGPIEVAGVTIHPVPPSHNRLLRMIQTAKKVFAVGASLNGDIYHFHDPEGLGIAQKYQKQLHKPFIYDAHEDYRLDILDKPWLPLIARGTVARWFGKKEDRLSPRLAGVIAATAGIGRRFTNCRDAAVIQNFPLLQELNQNITSRPETGAFAYVGVISPQRGIKEMVQALELAGPGARLSLAGKFNQPAVREEVATLPGWKKVDELGVLSRADVGELLGRSSAGLLPFLPIPSHLQSQPNKLFEYLSAGLPVIASHFPLWREIIESNACGLLVDPEKPTEIAFALDYSMSHPEEMKAMGERGRKAIEEKYNWEREFPKLMAFYQKIVSHWK